MATVLVVDDSPVDRRLVGALLEKQPGWKAVYAEDGRQALELLAGQTPDAVLTDLNMPGLNGLELVEAVKARFPGLPVILMTAVGSEELATLALHQGAASYVPKRDLARQLHVTVANVLDVAQTRRGQQRVLDCLQRTERTFHLGNDLSLVPHLVAHLRESLADLKLGDDNDVLRVSVALREALTNAICHGNLEMGPPPEWGDDAAEKRFVERAQQPPYRDRRVHLTVTESPEEVVYVVRDEGPGFDVASLPAPGDPAAFEKFGDRGLTLIRSFMDEVRFNAAGNEITLVRRCRR
jgi:CheY-like chemotaxis protein